MSATQAPKKRHPRQRFAFSTISSVLVVVAVVSALALVHDWGKAAIPAIEWICGSSAVLLVLSLIVDARRP